MANSLKHEVAHLIQEFESKSLAVGSGGSKSDMQKSDHTRDHYMVDQGLKADDDQEEAGRLLLAA